MAPARSARNPNRNPAAHTRGGGNTTSRGEPASVRPRQTGPIGYPENRDCVAVRARSSAPPLLARVGEIPFSGPISALPP